MIYIVKSILLDGTLDSKRINQFNKGDKLASFPHNFHPRNPVLGLIDSNIIFVHIEIDVHFITNFPRVVHEILIDIFFTQARRSPQLLLQ